MTTKPRKTAPKPKPTASPRATKRAVKPAPPVEVESPVAPPLDAVDTPGAPRRRTPNNKRRGATAPPNPAELVALRERERKAVELAAAGVTDWDLIATQAGYADRSAAWKAVQRVLDRQEFAAVADYRRLVGYRLERIVRANWAAAMTVEETMAKEKATNRVLRATEQTRRVFGLDVEVDKLADALRLPDDPAARAAELRDLRDGLRSLRVVGGTDTDT